MNNTPFVSIIIPVYNVENYLGECMDGILKRQNFDDFEVILINDGSRDSSPQICDSYAEQYSRIKVVHKPNGGASSARNAGLRKATGKYILFIDADDYIEDNSLEKIAALIKNEGEVDLVLLNTVNVRTDGSMAQREKFTKLHFFKQTHAQVLQNMSSCLPDCVWGKLIKREIIIRNDIFFVEGIICEDVDFTIKLFMNAESYNTADFNYYYYRENREGSVMNLLKIKTFTDLLFIITKWDSLLGHQYRAHTAVLRNWIFGNYCWALLTRYRKLPRDEKQAYKHRVDNLKHILTYSKDAGAFFVRTGYKLFGLNIASWISSIYAFVFIWKEFSIKGLFSGKGGVCNKKQATFH